MLKYYRERQDTLHATAGRRIYNYGSAALLLIVGVWVFTVHASPLIFWISVVASYGLDTFLIRRWIREDALRAYRADHPA